MTTEPAILAVQLGREPFAWPGGYPRAAITDDGGALCPDCTRENRPEIADSNPGDGWHVIALEVLEDLENPEFCDHCGRQIT